MKYLSHSASFQTWEKIAPSISGTKQLVLAAANAEGIVTKRRNGVGRRAGGNPFSRGAMYALLSNPTYVGRVAHRGNVYDGQHAPIVDREIWNAVQAKLETAAPKRRSRFNGKSEAMLAGLLFDETGDRLTPSHASKSGKRYRYYVSSRLNLAQDRSGWRLPAPMLERLVLDVIDGRLADPARLDGLPPQAMNDLQELQALQTKASDIRSDLSSADAQTRRATAQRTILRITIHQDRIEIALRLDALVESAGTDEVIEIAVPAKLKRRGVETKIVLQGERPQSSNADAKLIALVAQAHRWRAMLKDGNFQTLDQLAAAEGVSRWNISRHLPLAFLAPDIVEAILDGRQPVGLTANRLKRSLPLPPAWNDQRRLLGFAG